VRYNTNKYNIVLTFRPRRKMIALIFTAILAGFIATVVAINHLIENQDEDN
jgi:hypothetical protein